MHRFPEVSEVSEISCLGFGLSDLDEFAQGAALRAFVDKLMR